LFCFFFFCSIATDAGTNQYPGTSTVLFNEGCFAVVRSACNIMRKINDMMM
jgi:hypothetical protein